jgi:FkbM family methyltransferase
MKGLLKNLMATRSFEIRRSLPVITLEPLELVLALYGMRDQRMTIVQVGACDGITGDPLRHHIARISSRAILVEPNPIAFARLRKAYAGQSNVTLVQAAIGEQDGEADFYRIRSTGIPDTEVDVRLQIASFYRKHLERHGKRAEEIERITVRCRTLSSVLAEVGVDQIDLLQVDAEGFDAAVVSMALNMPVVPGCINFEHKHLTSPNRKSVFDSLKCKGYLVGYDSINVLALQKPLLEQFLQSRAPHP